MLVDLTPNLRKSWCMVTLSVLKFWIVSRMLTGVSGTPQTSQSGSSAEWNLNRLCMILEWPLRSLALGVPYLLLLEDSMASV